MSTEDWDKIGRKILRVELEKHSMNYVQLHAALKNIGIEESLPSMRNKFARGKFSATFFIQCLIAMGVDTLRLPEYISSLEDASDNVK
jgi:hypothetical protein